MQSSSDKASQIKDHYEKNFKYEDYIDHLEESYDDAPAIISFILTSINDFLKSGRFKGTSLLEIGSGPVFHNIANASKYYSHIVMSDYLKDNCDELKRWLKKQPTVKQFIDVAAAVEGGIADPKLRIKLIEDRIRSCVKQVIRFDILSDDVFMENLLPEVKPPYDMVISVFTLEAVAPDLEGYNQIYQRINKLLKPKGGLIVSGCFKGELWKVKETEFHHILVDKEDLFRALKMAKFENIELKTQSKQDIEHQYDEIFCVAANKI